MLKRLLEFGASEPYKRMVKERAKSMAAQALSAGEKNGGRGSKKVPLDSNQPQGGEQGTAEDKDGEPKEEAGGDSGTSGNDPSGEGEKNATNATGSKVPGTNDVLAAAHEEGEEDDVEKLLETSGELTFSTHRIDTRLTHPFTTLYSYASIILSTSTHHSNPNPNPHFLSGSVEKYTAAVGCCKRTSKGCVDAVARRVLAQRCGQLGEQCPSSGRSERSFECVESVGGRRGQRQHRERVQELAHRHGDQQGRERGAGDGHGEGRLDDLSRHRGQTRTEPAPIQHARQQPQHSRHRSAQDRKRVGDKDGNQHPGCHPEVVGCAGRREGVGVGRNGHRTGPETAGEARAHAGTAHRRHCAGGGPAGPHPGRLHPPRAQAGEVHLSGRGSGCRQVPAGDQPGADKASTGGVHSEHVDRPSEGRGVCDGPQRA